MKLEQQVTSLEISKWLKELGVKQESHFFHIYTKTGIRLVHPANQKNIKQWLLQGNDPFSAFTVAELGEMLKNGSSWANSNFSAGLPNWSERLNKWEYELPKGAWISCDTEADARGKMLIYLLA